jgi:DNA-3-methyladenine glycosylase
LFEVENVPRKVLPRAYFSRPTLRVARDLLGKYLIRENEAGLRAGRIIEVEAYIGPEDRASHASRGRTKRTEVMFGKAGIAYVYLVYGMHHCLNVVTEREGYPAAILIRAVEVEGTGLVDGPGRVCRLFRIDRTHNCLDLTMRQTLWLEDRSEQVPDSAVLATRRIGVDYAGEWAAKPWRFRLKKANSKTQTANG